MIWGFLKDTFIFQQSRIFDTFTEKTDNRIPPISMPISLKSNEAAVILLGKGGPPTV